MSMVEIKTPDGLFESNVLNETDWKVREIFIEFTAYNKDGQSIGNKNDFRLGLAPGSSGEPYKASKFIGETGISWGGTTPQLSAHIVRAKGTPPTED